MVEEALRKDWEEICFHLSDSISPNIKENVFEQKVLLTLEKRGWSQFKGEIQVKVPLQVGRQHSIIPDIVLYSNNRAVVVLEIKRPAEDLSRPGCFGQLQSYMRQTRAEFGLLVGKEIHVYYEGPLSRLPEPLLLSKIHFRSDSAEGIEFVKLFKRDGFEETYKSYLEAQIARLEIEREIQTTREQLKSEETRNKLFEFLQNEFGNVKPQVLEEAMKDLNINISFRSHYENDINKPPETVISNGLQETTVVSVCKNKSSGKHFIYIEHLENKYRLVIPDGNIKVLNVDLFDEPKEESIDYLLSYKLIDRLQLTKYNEYISREAKGQDELDENHTDQNQIRGTRHTGRPPRRTIPRNRLPHRRRTILPSGCTVEGMHFDYGSKAIVYLVKIGTVPQRDLPTCSTNWHRWLKDHQHQYNFKYKRDEV